MTKCLPAPAFMKHRDILMEKIGKYWYVQAENDVKEWMEEHRLEEHRLEESKKRMKKKKNKQKYEIINIKKKIESGYESPVLQPWETTPSAFAEEEETSTGNTDVNSDILKIIWNNILKTQMKPSRCPMFDDIKAFWTYRQCRCDRNAKQRKKNVDTKRKKKVKRKIKNVQSVQLFTTF